MYVCMAMCASVLRPAAHIVARDRIAALAVGGVRATNQLPTHSARPRIRSSAVVPMIDRQLMYVCMYVCM